MKHFRFEIHYDDSKEYFQVYLKDWRVSSIVKAIKLDSAKPTSAGREKLFGRFLATMNEMSGLEELHQTSGLARYPCRGGYILIDVFTFHGN